GFASFTNVPRRVSINATKPDFCFRSQNPSPNEDQLSVFLFVLDSLSISLFRRSMPLTYEYLTKRQKFFLFEGFHKIGDNTFPNMVPLLSGLRTRTEQADMPVEVRMVYARDYFDNFPLIWKNFSAAGYETTFLEDWPKFGLFQYAKKGFRRKPV